jgi:hypothetical protein
MLLFIKSLRFAFMERFFHCYSGFLAHLRRAPMWLVALLLFFSAPSCMFDPSGAKTTELPICGDGIQEGQEQCDGQDLGGATCVSEGFSSGTLVCGDDCSFDTSGCVSFDCGNGQQEGNEDCDGADLAGASCASLGFRSGTLSCENNCRFDTTECVPYMCGDNIMDPGESCDGTNLGGQTCIDRGYTGGDLTCTNDCTLDESGCTSAPNCGNGQIDGDEECDDGGESFTCDANCTVAECGDNTLNVTAGEQCDDGGQSAACDADCTVAECGDGTVNDSAGEQCDDGGQSAACDADCTVAECGDGTVNDSAGEQCDDGGQSAACDADCTVAECGDGTVNGSAGEQCDDENYSNNDDCLNNCQSSTCGDGYIHTQDEECDGNNLGGLDCQALGFDDGTLSCTTSCTLDDTQCITTTGGIGASCATHADCASSFCLTEANTGLPGGYCTLDCSSESCPLGSACFWTDQGDRLCFKTCNTTNDCRNGQGGYGCFYDNNVGQLMCFPNCDSDAQCTATPNCNRYTGFCEPDTGGPVNGTPCASDADCRGFCIEQDGQNWHQGYCSSPCTYSLDNCPNGNVCVQDLFFSAQGDGGACYVSCNISDDCRDEYTCDTPVWVRNARHDFCHDL